MSTRRNVQYSPLPTEDRDNLGFKYTPKSHRKIPWKSIALAFFLLIIGISLLFLSYFIFTSHMDGDGSQAYGLLFLGVLAFLPGYYETRVAYYLERSTRVHLRIHPRLLAIFVSRSVVVRQEGQARRQLIEPQMELQNERLGMICIGNISSETKLYSIFMHGLTWQHCNNAAQNAGKIAT